MKDEQPLLALDPLEKAYLASFIDGMHEYAYLSAKIEAQNKSKVAAMPGQLEALEALCTKCSAHTDPVARIFDKSAEQLSKAQAWDECLVHFQTRIRGDVVSDRSIDAFCALVTASGGVKRIVESRSIREIPSDLAKRTENIRNGSPRNKMSHLGCTVVAVAGILGTLGTCLACGVGAIGATAIGGCY